MTAFKKMTALFLIIILCFSLFSCKEEIKNRDYDKAEVEAAARVLIEKSLILNEILYGKGIGYIEDDSALIYKEADKESLKSFGVSSIAEIRDEISQVFSSKYIENIEKSDIFKPLVEDNVTISTTRYFEDGEGEEKVFYVNSAYEYVLKNSYEYLSDITAVRSEGEYVIIKARVKATRSDDGRIKTFDNEIKLIEESAGWRLASTTFVVYNKSTDIYNGIDK